MGFTGTVGALDDAPADRVLQARSALATAHGSRFLRVLLVGLDASALAIAWAIALTTVATVVQPVESVVAVAVVLAGVGVTVFAVSGLHRARACTLRTLEFARVARGCIVLGLLAVALAAVAEGLVALREIAVAVPLAFVLVAIERSGYRTWLTGRRRIGEYLRPIILVGADDEAEAVASLLFEHPELGYRVVGVVGDRRRARANGLDALWLGDLDSSLDVLLSTGATGSIVCAGDVAARDLNDTVHDLLGVGAHVQLSSGLRGVNVGRFRPSPLAHEPLFYVEAMRLASWQLVVKRAIDLVVAAGALVLTVPVLVVSAIGIKLTSRGPVIFRQRRVGRDGEPFTLYKLRTMRVGAEDETAGLLELNGRDGPLLKLPHDPRVTRLGRVLRATSIDELPQLWNVLNGTMSLVGPRPALPHEVVGFDAELRAREAVRPGITGLWQVEGRDNPSFAAYRRFDLFYLQNWTVGLDLMILLGTIEAVIARIVRAALHPGQDIQIAPPEVLDPRRHASDRPSHRPSTAPSMPALATDSRRTGVLS